LLAQYSDVIGYVINKY